jgi:DNA-binding transcriptional regulator YiaG
MRKRMPISQRSALETLIEQIHRRFPDAKLTLDAAATKRGTHFLDILLEGHHVEVQWKDGFGFGVSCAAEHFYGEGPDEVYADEEAAYGRIVSLLLSKTYTAAPEPVRLAELRRERGVSQEALAQILEVRQAAISKLERRNDLLVSSVREVVRSMGGELRIVAAFPDGMERTLVFNDIPSAASKPSKPKPKK